MLFTPFAVPAFGRVRDCRTVFVYFVVEAMAEDGDRLLFRPFNTIVQRKQLDIGESFFCPYLDTSASPMVELPLSGTFHFVDSAHLGGIRDEHGRPRIFSTFLKTQPSKRPPRHQEKKHRDEVQAAFLLSYIGCIVDCSVAFMHCMEYGVCFRIRGFSVDAVCLFSIPILHCRRCGNYGILSSSYRICCRCNPVLLGETGGSLP